ncbi:bacteriocin-like protein [Chryseobacterium sp. SIMBA_028]|uniref:bacteriocin-like protein n=1 Tax=Chryseobacterium sp. SIMBA_028 TaxID=3085771 RepID=UPI0039790811
MKNLKKLSRQDLKNVKGALNAVLPLQIGCAVRCVCTSTVDGSPFIGICNSRTGLCCSA